MDTKYEVKNPQTGEVMFADELLVLNQLLAMSQQGLDTRDSLAVLTYSERYANLLNEKYGRTDVSPTLAWLIATAVTKKLTELKENFTNGL